MRQILKTVRDYIRDQRGTVAIEFVLIAPVMILIFFGTAELSQGIGADRKVTLTARAISDIVARTATTTDSDLKNAFIASSYILRPFPLAGLTATVSAIDFNASGTPSVSWQVKMTSSGSGASFNSVAQKSVGSIPTDLRVPNTQLIKADVSYTYVPGSAFFIKSLPLTETFFARPRKDSGKVVCSSGCS